MRWNLSTQQAWIGFGISVLLFAMIGILGYRSMIMVMNAVSARKQSHYTIVKIEDFLAHITDAETGQRGYLLTGRDGYLHPYQQAVTILNQDFKELQRLLSYSYRQEQRLDAISPLLQIKLDELQNAITVRQAHGFNAALQMVQTNRGQKAMEQIRLLAHALEREENRVYQERDEAVARNFQNTIIFSSIAGFLGISLLAFIYILLIQQMNARQKANDKLASEIMVRKQAEDQINELNRVLEKQVVTLEATNKELEAFAYSVSHDLRAPLRSIDGFSKMLLTKTKDRLDESEQRYLNNVCENSQRMGELIDDLLKLSRLTRTEMEHTDVNLSAMAQDILSEFQKQDPERHVNAVITDDIVVNGDTNLLRVLMDNLLGNAWKFTGQRDDATIEFGIQKENNKPVYYVRDNGAGFNMKYVDKLFGVFQRLHRMEEFPGTGIGLATVARIIHRHGGKVWAEGNINQGATFYFSF